MDKATSQIKLYEHFLGFFLPKGILDFFEVVWIDERSLTASESKQGTLYSSVLQIHLSSAEDGLLRRGTMSF